MANVGRCERGLPLRHGGAVPPLARREAAPFCPLCGHFPRLTGESPDKGRQEQVRKKEKAPQISLAMGETVWYNGREIKNTQPEVA